MLGCCLLPEISLVACAGKSIERARTEGVIRSTGRSLLNVPAVFCTIRFLFLAGVSMMVKWGGELMNACASIRTRFRDRLEIVNCLFIVMVEVASHLLMI